ncbi:protein NLRC3-like isoform X3 [Boleophthalmus pectinirostris]|uniref:protein NLRC3-like isoform X3 n=1 Tax=Boleophthalmus pectinirostris TaxID=150288 RepID=UPI00242CBF80|nr:protein NLRC3-like isoform X3 [Boleophthalmus pectinirostris]
MEVDVEPGSSSETTPRRDSDPHLTPPVTMDSNNTVHVVSFRKTRLRPGPSLESLKSNMSKDFGLDFRRTPFPEPGPSLESLKSNMSKDFGLDFRRRIIPEPGPVCESLKSDMSKDFGLDFKRRIIPEPGPSLESLKSNMSKDFGLDFKRDDLEQNRGNLQTQQDAQEEEITRLLTKLNPEEKHRKEVLQNTSFELEPQGSTVEECGVDLRRHLQRRFSRVFEGVAKAGSPAPLNQIYTDLYITEGGTAGVNQEHEVINIENFSMKPAETTITCEDMFKGPPDSQGPIRTVLTKGVAGIGKTVLTQKLSLDWAEGRAHQDLQLLFPFTFRELNVLRDTQFSLVELLHHFFSPSKHLCSFEDLQVLFIFDGLDECRLPLDFSQTRFLSDPTESTSVHVLLVNLIRGSLLPSARLWITTRPAAANQIPAWCVSMVTEVRGFTDPQKEQYLRKRFSDEHKSTAIISHIKSIRSLHIMSHLPIFCWILSTVLQKLLEQTKPELPQTLTQMYVHFLVVQAKVKNIKYHQGSGEDLHWTPETREMVKSLGKLAFEQLQKGNLIFYESDLSECGLDAAAASVYSGVFTQIFREEPGLYQDKVYCFIHLSVQEFLAALHVHQTFFSSGVNLLSSPHSSESPDPEADFYRSAVDQTLQSPNGHLDLFLRFLLGLSLPTNQRLLQGLLTHTGSDRTNQETVKYIKQKLDEEGLSAERRMNLLHCLNELNDHSLVQEVQSFMKNGRLSHYQLSPAQWSAVSFFLLCSDLSEFDLKQYRSSETALLKLMRVVKASTKAILSSCNLTELSCAPLASVLSSSSLTHLDLSNNDLQDSGVELLCSGLKSAPCRLETLSLSGCLVSESGGAALASALSSVPSHLREFDLSYNHPGPSAKLLSALQDQRPLLSVRLDPAGEQWMVPGLRKYLCDVSLEPNSAHRRLVVSADRLTVTHEEDEEQEEEQSPDHEDRFLLWPQVRSSSGLRGRCFWEVQWRGWVDVAVTYRPTGDTEEKFGQSHQSWSLRIKDRKFYVCHNDTEILVMSNGSNMSSQEGVSSGRVGVSSGRVGVYLDSDAGSVSFYQVFTNNKLSHLHTFSIALDSELLFPGFHLSYPGSSVRICR